MAARRSRRTQAALKKYDAWLLARFVLRDERARMRACAHVYIYHARAHDTRMYITMHADTYRAYVYNTHMDYTTRMYARMNIITHAR